MDFGCSRQVQNQRLFADHPHPGGRKWPSEQVQTDLAHPFTEARHFTIQLTPASRPKHRGAQGRFRPSSEPVAAHLIHQLPQGLLDDWLFVRDQAGLGLNGWSTRLPATFQSRDAFILINAGGAVRNRHQADA